MTYSCDALGQQTLVNDSVSGQTSYSYDSLGNVTAVTSPQGTVNQTYDPATGQLIRTWTSDGAIDESFAYDALGRLRR